MTVDTEEVAYTIAEAAPALTDTEYFSKISELQEACSDIETCSPGCQLFRLVRVNTAGAIKVIHITKASMNTGGFGSLPNLLDALDL